MYQNNAIIFVFLLTTAKRKWNKIFYVNFWDIWTINTYIPYCCNKNKILPPAIREGFNFCNAAYITTTGLNFADYQPFSFIQSKWFKTKMTASESNKKTVEWINISVSNTAKR